MKSLNSGKGVPLPQIPSLFIYAMFFGSDAPEKTEDHHEHSRRRTKHKILVRHRMVWGVNLLEIKGWGPDPNIWSWFRLLTSSKFPEH